MALSWLLLILLALAVIGYFAGRSRALASADGDARALHSLPSYYGYNVALTALIPALGILIIWLLAQPLIVENTVSGMIPDTAISEGSDRGLVMSEVRRVAYGLDGAIASGLLSEAQARNADADVQALTQSLKDAGQVLTQDISKPILLAAQKYRGITSTGSIAMQMAVLIVALVGAALAYIRTHKEFRARNVVEQGILALLLLAASIAILTTVGIVLSMLFETMNFFQLHSWKDFFLGSTWAPNFRGGSELSILPLLWGTLYISLVALLVAVPVGLFAAIYLSEYATGATRSIAKPLLEILAGIPTIVYGLFALLTVGPALVSLFGDGGALGLGWMASSNAVLTAGLVMGIMLIPFVSSLSDDIINAVPQSMRDGSLGLGATKSETVRQVVLPAALPGIVGAILLAASRAIGETMIVVMAAGAIAKFSGNPFEAMTTITTRIVSQLTGDTDFASPETLVAFALGLTLFIITLGLNIFALYIVRKYREQYE
ncbi:phosphate ABC transporter membrane protein 1, PhoT family [Ruegeria halocynthiae]|uniref:Phosphate transport system permease protein n=1 Tax=Ruegeria halocynthiae TaxID=985054 RepID=A0A1H2TC03_9RHOB|nr:phosphate ABC transporter permease subunit PstC [Ruegeria halocynthiae]SDW41483.1 phosphate ABC transporter membrane protein 1, PhoT family [Ruegeria halocynthiae]